MVLKPSETKILGVLKTLKNKSICSSDLAELCEINKKNIGRYLKTLLELNLIRIVIQQTHNVRMKMITLSQEGKTTDYINEIIDLDKAKSILTPTEKVKQIRKKNNEKKKKENVKFMSKNFLSMSVKILIDEFEQLKSYFRSSNNRPSQRKAIENFEKHLGDLI